MRLPGSLTFMKAEIVDHKRSKIGLKLGQHRGGIRAGGQNHIAEAALVGKKPVPSWSPATYGRQVRCWAPIYRLFEPGYCAAGSRITPVTRNATKGVGTDGYP